MRIRDLEAAIAAVSKVYCRHTANVDARVAGVDLDLEVGRAGSQSLIRMSYGAPVSIDAEWGAGETLPLSRLQMVRDALQRPDQQNSITDIALQCGFSHLGRFSAQYRQAFGEAPSATLRRRR
jgi:AraC-like DNA-binding protein